MGEVRWKMYVVFICLYLLLMRILRNTWLRVIISLFAGGMTSELIFIFSGDPTRHRSADEPNYSIAYALVWYILLTVLYRELRKNSRFKVD